MILLSCPLKNDPLKTTVSIFFLEIEIFTTKIVNSKSLKKICRELLSTMNVLKLNSKRSFHMKQFINVFDWMGMHSQTKIRVRELDYNSCEARLRQIHKRTWKTGR